MLLRFRSTEMTTSTRAFWGDIYARKNSIMQDYTIQVTETETTRFYEKYEGALEGYDAEVGVKVPYMERLAETRVFLGYHNFDNPVGSDLDGFRGRVEVRAVPALAIDAEWYEEEDLNNTEYVVGARLRLPLDVSALSQGGNPFRQVSEDFRPGAHRLLADRLTEMVIRDMKVQTQEGEYEENQTRSTSRSTSSTRAETTTLVDNITFVDGDNEGDPLEDGTAEHPYDVVQEGVDNANSPVLVYDAADVYEENVVVHQGVDLYGNGTVLEGFGGRVYGGGEYPVLDGRSMGPTVELMGDNTLAGLKIINTEQCTPADDRMLEGDLGVKDVRRVGILANGANNLDIRRNVVVQNDQGAVLVRDGNFNTIIEDNYFDNNADMGLLIAGEGSSGVFDTYLEGNTFSGNAGVGLLIMAEDYDQASATILETVANGNNEAGIAVNIMDTPGAVVTMSDITANDNGSDGISVASYADYNDLTVTMSDITANANGSDGVNISPYGYYSYLTVTMTDVTANGNSNDGIDISPHGYYYNDVTVNMTDVTANDNGSDGVDIGPYSYYGNDLTVTMTGITANGNNSDGVDISPFGYYGNEVTVTMNDVTANDNSDDGIDVSPFAWGYYNYLTVTMTGVEARGNSDDGIDIGPYGYYGDVTLTMTDVEATGNADDGVDIDPMVYYGDLEVSLTDVTASDNGEGGIELEPYFFYGEAMVNMTRLTANNNGDDGVEIDMRPVFGATLTLTDVTANDNPDDGINVDLYSYDGDLTVTMADIAASGNSDDGVVVEVYSDEDANLVISDSVIRNNLGIGVVADIGDVSPESEDATVTGSSIYGNGVYDLVETGGGDGVNAENNWWGTASPAPGQFDGNVDWNPWLTTDPNL